MPTIHPEGRFRFDTTQAAYGFINRLDKHGCTAVAQRIAVLGERWADLTLDDLTLDVSASTVARLLAGASAVSPEMALRLAKTLGRSAESWLLMQHNHDLWQARQRVDLSRVEPLHFDAA